MKKLFVIYWDKSYSASVAEKPKVVGEEFFGHHNAFDNEEQNAIQRLDIGETSPMDNNHVWVMRVK